MEIKDFCSLIIDTLSDEKEIMHMLKSDNSILAACNDGSNYYINILESKRTFIHGREDNEFIKEYMMKHSKEGFAENILGMIEEQPGFFCYFMILHKLKEMKIIDTVLFYHIMDNIIWNTQELNEFISRLLNHFCSH